MRNYSIKLGVLSVIFMQSVGFAAGVNPFALPLPPIIIQTDNNHTSQIVINYEIKKNQKEIGHISINYELLSTDFSEPYRLYSKWVALKSPSDITQSSDFSPILEANELSTDNKILDINSVIKTLGQDDPKYSSVSGNLLAVLNAGNRPFEGEGSLVPQSLLINLVNENNISTSQQGMALEIKAQGEQIKDLLLAYRPLQDNSLTLKWADKSRGIADEASIDVLKGEALPISIKAFVKDLEVGTYEYKVEYKTEGNDTGIFLFNIVVEKDSVEAEAKVAALAAEKAAAEKAAETETEAEAAVLVVAEAALAKVELALALAKEGNRPKSPVTTSNGLPLRYFPNYIDTVLNRDIWKAIGSPSNVLYWDEGINGFSPKLISEVNGEREVIDNTSRPVFNFPDRGGLVINRPLGLGITIYPQCIGLDPNTHQLTCNSKEIITKNTVYSQRWDRPKNRVDRAGNIADQSISINLTAMQYFGEGFEISVSKVPGDFSETSCRPKNIGLGTTRVSLAEKGGSRADGNSANGRDVDATCWVNANRWKHYYINVRSIEQDPEKQCSALNKCEFKIDR